VALGEGRRGETGGMGVRLALPLRVLLPCLAVGLAAAGAAAIGVAAVSAAGGFATGRADDAVRACAGGVLSRGPVIVPGYGLVAVPGSGLVPGPAGSGACGAELVSTSGQVLIPAAPGSPAVPASGSWLAAHLAGPVTVPGAGGGGRWRVLITAVRYQAQHMMFVYGRDDIRYVISGQAGHGSGGMLIVMAGVAGTGQLAAGAAAVAGSVLVLLAAAAFAAIWAILRPLRAPGGLTVDAGQDAIGAIGRLEEALARVGVPASGPPGQDAMMLAGIRERLRASRADEAAARRSAAGLAGQLARTCLQLRRPAGIVAGYAGYLRQQHKPEPASPGPMLHQVIGEITRLETLIEGLRTPAAGDPAGTDRQPGPPAGTGCQPGPPAGRSRDDSDRGVR
jgi:hypothetical protein